MKDSMFSMIGLGIGLVVLVALIGAVFAIFGTSKNTANDGVVQLQSTIGMLNDSVYTDFDQTTVSGTQVKSVYTQMAGQPIAIIVKTCRGGWTNYNAVVTPFAKDTLSKPSNNCAWAPFDGIKFDASSKKPVISVASFTKTSSSTDAALILENDAVVYNPDTAAMNKKGGVGYITATSTFTANLIKDTSEGVIGIVFIENGKHSG